MSFIEMEQTIACQQMEIDDLHGKLKEAQAEIERLKEENIAFACNLRGKHAITGATYEILCTQLAASQANEVQLREALSQGYGWAPIGSTSKSIMYMALSLPSDTTALDAMIQKAGEVMRERCAVEAERDACPAYEYVSTAVPGKGIADEIRAIPGVTLEDLK